MVHQSDSTEQRAVEPVILEALERRLGVSLKPRSLTLGGRARVDVDGVADDESVLVEIFAHQGRLRGGQFHKVARDALKLITLARTRPNPRLILAFGDPDAAACVTAKSWLAEALRTWGVEAFVAELDDGVRTGLRAAQARQVMVNPGAHQSSERRLGATPETAANSCPPAVLGASRYQPRIPRSVEAPG